MVASSPGMASPLSVPMLSTLGTVAHISCSESFAILQGAVRGLRICSDAVCVLMLWAASPQIP